LAIWGHNFEPLNCELHKQEDQQNLVERPCVSCHLKSVLDRSDLCENCGVWDKVKLSKQNALMTFLDACGFEGVSTDRIVDGGECGRERPDRVFYFDSKVVIVECDENQHQSILESCEYARMVTLGQMYGGAPVYFIRFNPDKYNTGDEALRARHEIVAAILRDIQDGRMELPHALTSALYLYYDGWQGMHREEWRVLMAYDTA
jgi:Holliday junction resolvase